MIDLRSENVLSLSEATEHLPHRRGGRAVHVATLYRWAQQGVRGIRLEVLQCGGTKVTSLEALQRFFERLSAVAGGDTPPVRTAKQRQRASAIANDELASAGW